MKDPTSQPLRDERILVAQASAANVRRSIEDALKRMGFTIREEAGGLIGARGSREQWWRDGLHAVPHKLELLPVRVEIEAKDALDGSLVRVALRDAWRGGIRAGAEEVYRPCFVAVLDDLCRSAHLSEVFSLTSTEIPSRWSGRRRAYLALALSVVLLTLAVFTLEALVRVIFSALGR